jgi:hypothetical protein
MQITQNEPTAAKRRIPFLAVRASANSLQLVDLNDIASGDTFTLTYDAQTTSSIAFDSFTSDDGSALITSALEALSNIADDEVQVFRIGSTQTYAIGFGGSFVGTSVVLLTATPTGFTMGDITGGVADSAVVGLGASWPAADIRIKKAGVAEAESDGTVDEGVDGVYDYLAAAGEVDTLGPLYGTVRTFGVSVYPFSAQVVEAGSAGETVLRTGTAQAGAAGSITLDSGASGTSDQYAPCLVYIESGTGAGQGAVYGHAYNGTTKVLSVEPEFVTPPDNTSVFKLVLTAPIAWDFGRANHADPDTFGDVETSNDVALEVLDTMTTDATPFAGANIDAAISTRASATALQTVDDEVAAVDGKLGTPAVTLAADLATVASYIDTEIAALTSSVGNLPSATTIADALLDRNNGVESSVTPRQAFRLMLAVLAGKVTVSGNNVTFRNVGDTVDRVTAVTTTAGARSSVTTNVI